MKHIYLNKSIIFKKTFFIFFTIIFFLNCSSMIEESQIEESCEISPHSRLTPITYNSIINEASFKEIFPILQSSLGFKEGEFKFQYARDPKNNFDYISFLSPFMKRKEYAFNLDHYEKLRTEFKETIFTSKEQKRIFISKLKNARKNLVGAYKIHFMPTTAHDLMIIIEQLIWATINDPKFAKKIYAFKFLKGIDFSQSPENIVKQITHKTGGILPLIALYPIDGKENAQFILNYVYNLFKDIPGLGVAPRYNQKITDLIFYAQGDGGRKTDHYKKYYTPDRIFYRPYFEKKKYPIDYSLNNPALNN